MGGVKVILFIHMDRKKKLLLMGGIAEAAILIFEVRFTTNSISIEGETSMYMIGVSCSLG